SRTAQSGAASVCRFGLPVTRTLYRGRNSAVRTILLGNAGAGKSTLSKRLIAKQPAARLSLDEVAFHNGAQRRPIQDSIADVRLFIAHNESWMIEGCYADCIEPIMCVCDELIFLSPGVETCIAHCRACPWEAEKFSSTEGQDENWENLIDWGAAYDARSDGYGR